MSNQVYATASFTAPYQVGQVRMRYPIPQDPTAIFYDVTFESSAAAYPAPVIGASYTAGAPGAQLVTPGPVDWVDATLVRYTNTYATVPAARTESENYQMHYPAFYSSGGGLIRYALNRTLSSQLFYRYIDSTAGGTFTVNLPFAPYLSGNANALVDYVQDSVTVPDLTTYVSWIAGSTVIYCESTDYTRWAGNIFQIKDRVIHAQ